MIIKALLAWIVIAVAETLHGILRVKLLNPRFGDRRARRLAVPTGTAIILLIGWFTVPWIGWRRIAEDFDVRKGGLLGFGMAAMFFTPLLIARMRGLF